MNLMPSSKTGKVAFLKSKLAPWQDHAVDIGTTAAAVTGLQTLLTAAQEKLDAQVAADEAAKTATMAANNAVAAAAAAGADIIKAIRAKAAIGGEAVYEMAEIPGPATPTPVVTLGMPTEIKAELGQDGLLTLKWKCANPRATGTVYQVSRSLDGGASFTYIGGTGPKRFIDETVPAGSASMMYKIQAVRSTAVGPVATFTVMFGVSSAGTMMAGVRPRSAPTRLAA